MPASKTDYVGFYGKFGCVKEFRAKSLRALALEMGISYTSAMRAEANPGQMCLKIPVSFQPMPRVSSTSSDH